MSFGLLDLLEETFRDIDSLNGEKIEQLTSAVSDYLSMAVEQCSEGSFEDTQKATQELLKIQQFLNDISNTLPSPENLKLSFEDTARINEMKGAFSSINNKNINPKIMR